MIRLGKTSDIKAILEIIEEAKSRLRQLNVNQWQEGYPNEIGRASCRERV